MKKVWKGWIGGNDIDLEVFWWEHGKLKTQPIGPIIEKAKGKLFEWSPENWPPKRVTITVEVED